MNRFVVILFTAASGLWLLIELVFLWPYGVFLVPRYQVYSFSEVLKIEIIWGVFNVLLESFLLFIPMYIIAFFIKTTISFYNLKRTIIVALIALIISSVFVGRLVLGFISIWTPLENASKSFDSKNYELGRTMLFPLRQYTVYFTKKTSDFLFINNEIIPTLEKTGYTLDNFTLSIGGETYTNEKSIAEPPPVEVIVEDISEIPLDTPLSRENFDHATLSFHKSNSSDPKSITIHIEPYDGNGFVKGFVR